MRSRSRLIAVAASMLVCVAMVGTGFASWVILDTKTGAATGNVTAEGVAGQEIELSVSVPVDAEIKFGSPATMEAHNPWLVESESSGQGKFSVDITVTVKGNIGSFTIDFSHEGTAFETAVTNNLIVGYPTYTVGSTTPTGSIDNASQIAIEQASGKATLKFGSADKSASYNFAESTTFHIIATFSWGSAFEVAGKATNPYEYFNNKTSTEMVGSTDGWDKRTTFKTPTMPENLVSTTWAALAKDVLMWMEESFTGVTYTVTFTAAQAALSTAAG